jgi:hypothetical protein
MVTGRGAPPEQKARFDDPGSEGKRLPTLSFDCRSEEFAIERRSPSPVIFVSNRGRSMTGTVWVQRVEDNPLLATELVFDTFARELRR